MRSILNTEKGVCYYCQIQSQTEKHHIFYGNPNRKLSERYGLWVYLCLEHHRTSPKAVHAGCREIDQALKVAGQRAFENRHGNRQDFVRIFGKNYLEAS